MSACLAPTSLGQAPLLIIGPGRQQVVWIEGLTLLIDSCHVFQRFFGLSVLAQFNEQFRRLWNQVASNQRCCLKVKANVYQVIQRLVLVDVKCRTEGKAAVCDKPDSQN